MKLLSTLTFLMLCIIAYAQPEEIIYIWHKPQDSVYIDEAVAKYTAGDFEGSLKALKKLSRRAASEPGNMYLKAINMQELEQHKEATEVLTKAITRNPKLVELYKVRGASYSVLNNFSAAMNDFNVYHGYFPEHLTTTLNMVYCLSEQKQLDKALELLGNFPNQDTTIANTMANLYIDKEDYLKAISILEPWRDKFPEFADGHETLSIAYYELDYYDEAMLEVGKLISLRPKYAYGYYLKGLYLEQLEAEEEARRFYEIARSLGFDPD